MFQSPSMILIPSLTIPRLPRQDPTSSSAVANLKAFAQRDKVIEAALRTTSPSLSFTCVLGHRCKARPSFLAPCTSIGAFAFMRRKGLSVSSREAEISGSSKNNVSLIILESGEISALVSFCKESIDEGRPGGRPSRGGDEWKYLFLLNHMRL